MRLGIIGPSETQIQPFLRLIKENKQEEHARLVCHVGTYKDVDLVTLYSGVCKVNAAIGCQTLIHYYGVTHILLVGVAGGIDPSLKIGDVVLGTSYGYHDVHDGILTDYHPFKETPYFYSHESFSKAINKLLTSHRDYGLYKGRIVTGEYFIDQVGRQEIIDHHNPLCVDMETTSVAHVAYAHDLPFIAVRAITDTQEVSGIETFEDHVDMASQRAVDVLVDLLDVFLEDQ